MEWIEEEARKRKLCARVRVGVYTLFLPFSLPCVGRGERGDNKGRRGRGKGTQSR